MVYPRGVKRTARGGPQKIFQDFLKKKKVLKIFYAFLKKSPQKIFQDSNF